MPRTGLSDHLLKPLVLFSSSGFTGLSSLRRQSSAFAVITISHQFEILKHSCSSDTTVLPYHCLLSSFAPDSFETRDWVTSLMGGLVHLKCTLVAKFSEG